MGSRRTCTGPTRCVPLGPSLALSPPCSLRPTDPLLPLARPQWTATTIDGKASAQFEETLLITETGVEVLTAAPGWTLPEPKGAAAPPQGNEQAQASGEKREGEGAAPKKKKKKAKKAGAASAPAADPAAPAGAEA